MDAATTKGVIARLLEKGLVSSRPDSKDLRRLKISLTADGEKMVITAIEAAQKITAETTSKLTAKEVSRLCSLLDKL